MQRTARVRIGRVKMKGGADVRVLPGLKDRRTVAAQSTFRRHAREVLDALADDMAGYVLVAWDGTAGHMVRYRFYASEGGAAVPGEVPGLNGAPEWLADALRRAIADDEAERRMGMPRTNG